MPHAAKRKTRCDKFALTLHPTGQFCKKIKGKLYYSGSDRQETLRRYLGFAEQTVSYLLTGR